MKPAAQDLLMIHVSTVVPLMIYDFIKSGGITNAHIERAKQLSGIVASHGDAILYRETKQTTEAINALCEGLAIMALACPGGVRFAGMHFDENSGHVLERLCCLDELETALILNLLLNH